MNKDTQLKELTDIIHDGSYHEEETAEDIYEAGYRKQVFGKWVYHECVSSYDGAKSGYACSNCSAFVDEQDFEKDDFHGKFCGACGAKMDGVYNG